MLFMNFLFNDTATTEIYTLSLHDALPIWKKRVIFQLLQVRMYRKDIIVTRNWVILMSRDIGPKRSILHRMLWKLHSSFCRSEEHTSELQSLAYLVCRLLLEKKKLLKLNNQ